VTREQLILLEWAALFACNSAWAYACSVRHRPALHTWSLRAATLADLRYRLAVRARLAGTR
jgi:hypothetical protein